MIRPYLSKIFANSVNECMCIPMNEVFSSPNPMFVFVFSEMKYRTLPWALLKFEMNVCNFLLLFCIHFLKKPYFSFKSCEQVYPIKRREVLTSALWSKKEKNRKNSHLIIHFSTSEE